VERRKSGERQTTVCVRNRQIAFGLTDTTRTNPVRRRRSQSSISDAVEGCSGLPCQMPPIGPEGPGRQSRHGRRQGGCQTRRTGRQTWWCDLAGSRTVVVASDRSRRHEAAAASRINFAKSPPVIFMRVQVSHIQCDWRRLEAVLNVIV